MNVGRISEPVISKNMSAFELFNTSLSSLHKLSHHIFRCSAVQEKVKGIVSIGVLLDYK